MCTVNISIVPLPTGKQAGTVEVENAGEQTGEQCTANTLVCEQSRTEAEAGDQNLTSATGQKAEQNCGFGEQAEQGICGKVVTLLGSGACAAAEASPGLGASKADKLQIICCFVVVCSLG